jgi:uncharacterized protein HemY
LPPDTSYRPPCDTIFDLDLESEHNLLNICIVLWEAFEWGLKHILVFSEVSEQWTSEESILACSLALSSSSLTNLFLSHVAGINLSLPSHRW